MIFSSSPKSRSKGDNYAPAFAFGIGSIASFFYVGSMSR
jgi:hypothetical protein